MDCSCLKICWHGYVNTFFSHEIYLPVGRNMHVLSLRQDAIRLQNIFLEIVVNTFLITVKSFSGILLTSNISNSGDYHLFSHGR